MDNSMVYIGMTKEFVHADKICHGYGAYNSMDICG
jgi:hypothetical protein